MYRIQTGAGAGAAHVRHGALSIAE